VLGCGALLPKTEDPKPPALDAAGVGPKLKVLPVAALLLAPKILDGVELGAPNTEPPGVPKAGVLVPGVPKGLGLLLAPKIDGLLVAPKAVVDEAAPKAEVELAPNRLVPVAGAPKASVLLAPNAAGALVPDPKGFDVAGAPKLKELPVDPPKGYRNRSRSAQQAGSGREEASSCSAQCCRPWACGCLVAWPETKQYT
jgi:hypothetical protein